MRTLFYVCLILITFSCNQFPDPDKGFSKEIRDMVPQWIIDDLKENNMAIYEGKRPPNIEGTYFTSPNILVKGYDNNDYSPGYTFADYSYRFYNQTARNQKISVGYESHNTDGYDYGDGEGTYTYVSGHGNYFTIFAELNGVTDGIGNQTIEVFSGEITREGIKNLTLAFTMKSKDNDYYDKLIPVGATRIIKDGDDFSEKYSDSFRMGAGNDKSASPSLPCILCNTQKSN